MFSHRAIAFTYDTWTSIANHCYVTLTGHFILNNRLERCTLSFLESSVSHESEVLSKIIQSELAKLPPGVKITGCVSDNAANMVATGKKLNFWHLGCFIHSVQLVIRDALVDCGTPQLKDKVGIILQTAMDVDVLQ